MFSGSRSLFSLNCVMRDSSPYGVTVERIHASSECSGTCDCTNSTERLGSMPDASSSAASVSTLARQLLGLVRLRERVQIDDAVEAAILVLQLDPVLHRAEVVADVKAARRLDA